MRRLNTAEFKREYRSLGEPVLVTSGGKVIGLYRPTNRSIIEAPWPTVTGKPSEHQVPARSLGAVLAAHETVRPAEERDGYSPTGWVRWRSPFRYPEDPNAR